MNDRLNMGRSQGVAEKYLAGCPDVLELRIAGRDDLSRSYPIGVDGVIQLEHYGAVRTEGKSLADISTAVAQKIGVKPADVGVRVAEFRSQSLYLFGEVVGWQRSVPYQGQETVLDLLQRVGGITPGAEPGDVYVVRAHVADAADPEVFHVELDKIVLKKDQKTNIRLMPQDQIYVGETRRARLEKCTPPILRPLLQLFWTPDTRIEKPTADWARHLFAPFVGANDPFPRAQIPNKPVLDNRRS